jgi:hypothetical protein
LRRGAPGYVADMPDPEEMQERLDEVERHIDEARKQADDDDLLPEDEPPDEYEPDGGMGGSSPA